MLLYFFEAIYNFLFWYAIRIFAIFNENFKKKFFFFWPFKDRFALIYQTNFKECYFVYKIFYNNDIDLLNNSFPKKYKNQAGRYINSCNYWSPISFFYMLLFFFENISKNTDILSRIAYIKNKQDLGEDLFFFKFNFFFKYVSRETNWEIFKKLILIQLNYYKIGFSKEVYLPIFFIFSFNDQFYIKLHKLWVPQKKIGVGDFEIKKYSIFTNFFTYTPIFRYFKSIDYFFKKKKKYKIKNVFINDFFFFKKKKRVLINNNFLYKFFILFKPKSFILLFLRKNRVFNKGRYSRNRQNYRSGVYWCLYINIIAVIGLYYLFYRFSFNFGFVWLFFGISILSMFLNKFIKLDIFFFLKKLFYWYLHIIKVILKKN